MTREETVKIVRIAYSNNPNIKIPDNISDIVDSWYFTLKEFDYNDIAISLATYNRTDTSGFLPTPAKLISILQKITQPQELNEMEAWALVSKAIRNSGYNSVEEFAKLPQLVQKAVGLPDQLRTWALDENYNEQVVSSNFMRCYRTELARHEELSKMPADVRTLIENASKGSYSAQIEEKREQAIKSLTDRKESEIKALEMNRECVPMPDYIEKRLEELKYE